MQQTPHFNTLYLHIGLGKTGTTSIQLDLWRMADQLDAGCGLHFPCALPEKTPFRGNHSMLLRAMFCNELRARKRLSSIGLHNDEQISAFNAANQRALELGFARTSAPQALLSAESIGHFSEDDLNDLARWAQDIGREVKLLACIRHPVHALSSEIQQRLRIGAKLANLYNNPPYYRFRTLFEGLEQAFGRDNIIAYSFHRAIEHQAGLTAALLEQIGVRLNSEIPSQKPANTRMSREATLLLSAFNEQVPAFVMGKANPARHGDEVRRLKDIPGGPYVAPLEVLERVRAASMADTRWMEARYGLDLEHPAPVSQEDTLDELSDKAITRREYLR